MAAAKLDPAVLAHLEWLGFVRPTGLVVSAPALVRAGAILNRQDSDGQRLLRQSLVGAPDAKDVARERSDLYDTGAEDEPRLRDFRDFARDVLGWKFSPRGYAGVDGTPIPSELEVALPEYGETLRPDLAVRELDPQEGGSAWQLLVTVLEPGEDLDRVVHRSGGLEASPHGRMERLLRQTGVPAGLICNHDVVRLISAPRGESSGWLDFRVPDMIQTAGRPIATALRLLLSETRLLSLPRSQRLAALLEDSRRFQNEVSERLAEQVLHALYDLLRGFQAADDASKGELLRRQLEEHPDEIYRALLTVILRLVFLLYAEERDMLSEDETFVRFYSIAGLYERLRQDAALYPDTMDQRFGAWAQLLVLFRMVHDGAEAGQLRLPPRRGVLFDPDRYTFLEGRSDAAFDLGGNSGPPLVPDGTVFRALEQLLVLDGERISYRALDVEQIGSIYETMMGFRLEVATGRAIAIRSEKRQGAPTCIDLDRLLGEAPANRNKWLRDAAGRKISTTIGSSITVAESVDDLHAALRPVVDFAATPDVMAPGSMLLQPSDERRRSGSHYTPKSLTEPIVRTALKPILARLSTDLGQHPTPEQILQVQVCDPAMGSGAFLVEACRQLADVLVASWRAHDSTPELLAHEDEITVARRIVAQRCIFGVDSNPVAVDLGKMSIWLLTLAQEFPLTFLDHALRHGDSLIGISISQLQSFDWAPGTKKQVGVETEEIRDQISASWELREQIRAARRGADVDELNHLLHESESHVINLRATANLLLDAFFSAENATSREKGRASRAQDLVAVGAVEAWLGRRGESPARDLVPFNWGLEFPEVFRRDRPGFDCIVGNPPFLGGRFISGTQSSRYRDWLSTAFPGSVGQVDLVAYFFRQAFELLRDDGVLGFISTMTIAQGATRRASLLWLLENGGQIVSASRRLHWPGQAAVMVSIVHIQRGNTVDEYWLDEQRVPRVSAFLLASGFDNDPVQLMDNANISFMGYYNYGEGFLFSDNSDKCESLDAMRQLITKDARNAERIHPYLGGDEMLTDPQQRHNRFVIDFGTMSEAEARQWPDLMEILERRVFPQRQRCNRQRLRDYWWQFGEVRPGLRAATVGRHRLLMHPYTSKHLAFAFVPAMTYIASPHFVFALESDAAFAILQSQLHEVWVRTFGGSRDERISYTASDCFETFPFPIGWQDSAELAEIGKSFYDVRQSALIELNVGLTEVYNMVHDPNESSPLIEQLRERQQKLDAAALKAYGLTTIDACNEFRSNRDRGASASGDDPRGSWFRWSDSARDAALGHLIDLNSRFAAEQVHSRRTVAATRPRKSVRSDSNESSASGDLSTLF